VSSEEVPSELLSDESNEGAIGFSLDSTNVSITTTTGLLLGANDFTS
jgi:hypothetical protein